MRKRKSNSLTIGDDVTYHYWHLDELRSYRAKVVGIHEPDDDAQALMLEVAFPEDVLAGGVLATQSHARMRTRGESDVHASGTWSLPA
jgi:hypothetical protein